jgi:iron complex outermembrane receptor protein
LAYCLEFLHYLKLAPKFSSRLGGGLGYKTPTIFTEDESIQYQNVLPINSDVNKLEKATVSILM